MIKIRHYESKDAPFLWTLKFNTIHTINIRDYSLAQVNAWAPDHLDLHLWQKRADAMNPFIAEFEGQIVGFADLQQDGYIDHFFCHAEHQRCGAGRALMEHIFATGRSNATPRYYSHVSLTARPFFEHFGFHVIEEQQVDVNGQQLTNFVMEKISMDHSV